MGLQVTPNSMPEFWYVLDVNPEPWSMGPINVVRKANKFIPFVGRNEQLDSYKRAVAEELKALNPSLIEGRVRLLFLFWRQRADYATHQARRHRKHEADLTNLVKATEDAIQGILIHNDRDTAEVAGYLVEQGPNVQGRIIICIQSAPDVPDIMAVLPEHVYRRMEESPELFDPTSNDFGVDSDVRDIF